MTDAESSRMALERDRLTCRFGLPGCRRDASGVHHIVGRSVREMRHEQLNLLSVCAPCHAWVEDNPREALEYVRTMLLGDAEWRKLTRMAWEAGASLE
jgi:hypothetical protein